MEGTATEDSARRKVKDYGNRELVSGIREGRKEKSPQLPTTGKILDNLFILFALLRTQSLLLDSPIVN